MSALMPCWRDRATRAATRHITDCSAPGAATRLLWNWFHQLLGEYHQGYHLLSGGAKSRQECSFMYRCRYAVSYKDLAYPNERSDDENEDRDQRMLLVALHRELLVRRICAIGTQPSARRLCTRALHKHRSGRYHDPWHTSRAARHGAGGRIGPSERTNDAVQRFVPCDNSFAGCAAAAESPLAASGLSAPPALEALCDMVDQAGLY